jgi:serine/threonine-protein kinase
MGMVVGVTHLQLQQRVALKFLLPDLVQNAELVERFVREARASAQLRGEHVCRVSDVGTAEGGAPYIVMELLEGNDLASLIEGNRSLPVALAADYVLQACVGVAEAHALGIVHRDLKPGNLFLTRRPDGTPLIKVLDFGIAKAQRDQRFTLTQTATVLGSPIYMSPEQLRSSRDADVRSDVWSLGVILYELATGRRPFDGESITELAVRIALDAPPAMDRHVPRGFELITLRCLAKDPAERYPDLAGLAAALVEFAGPAGHDRATAVSRLLGGASQSPKDVGSARRPARPADLIATTQPDVATGGGELRSATPTTMGSAASSMLPGAPATRRWGVIAGATVTVLLAAFAALAIVRNQGPQVSATSLPDAAMGAAASVLADARVEAAPIDATSPAPIDAARDAPGAVPTAPSDAAAPAHTTTPPRGPAKNPPNRPPPRHANPDPEDYGATRK